MFAGSAWRAGQLRSSWATRPYPPSLDSSNFLGVAIIQIPKLRAATSSEYFAQRASKYRQRRLSRIRVQARPHLFLLSSLFGRNSNASIAHASESNPISFRVVPRQLGARPYGRIKASRARAENANCSAL